MVTIDPNSAAGADERVGLALSGGGFRATLYHIGGLWRLNEMGWLPRITAISGCSGGAITAGWLGLVWRDFDFNSSGIASNFETVFANPLCRLCAGNHDLWPSLANMAAMLLGLPSAALTATYRNHLFGQATLADLPAPDQGPRVIFCTSNLVTGSEVHFSRAEIHDNRLGVLHLPETSIARVVAASSAFPPFLSPCIVNTDPERWHDVPGTDLFAEVELRRRMILTDGGIHDPLGLDPIRNCQTLLVSDATVTREVWRKPSSFWIRQLGRTTIMQTIANSRRVARALVRKMKDDDGPRIIHWCNAASIDACELPDALARDSATTAAMGEMRTRLNRFTPREQGELINWGYATCDAAMRSGSTLSHPPGALPIPDFRLD